MGDGFFMQITSQQPFFLQMHYACFSVIFPWTVREGYFVFRHISFNIQWTLFACFALSYPIYIRLFICLFIRLFICLTFLSCSAIRYIHFLLLLFEQSSLIYMLFSFLFTVTKPFSSFKVFNPILFNPTVARAYSLDFCRSYYRIMFSVLKYLGISCCWM